MEKKISYRIKAYTNHGLIKSLPFFDKEIALDILFKSICRGLVISSAYLCTSNSSTLIYSEKKETRPRTYTRPDGKVCYGISLRYYFEDLGFDYDQLISELLRKKN